MLHDVAVFLAAAVIAVPIAKRLGLGAVLGYLAAGVAIGPWGLKLITDVESILHFSEFGVVLLLFIVGLELQASRLWRLRREVFGLGGAQVAMSMLLLTGAALTLGLDGRSALVAGFGLAMSSTAFVLQMLAERGELTTRHGRASFAILLFQDLSVIPFLALVPMLAGNADAVANPWLSAAQIVVALIAVVAAGRFLLRPVFRAVAATRSPEVFTAAALLVVIGTALAMQAVGLSMSLGAFLAGVLLAESEYRHELQADIEPFKGLLLGLFFIAVGMSANLGLIGAHPWSIAALVAGLVALKAAVLYALGRVAKQPADSALAFAVTNSQGGEFAFVLFGVAGAAGILAPEVQQVLIVLVTASMMTTPLLYAAQARLRRAAEQPPYDEIQVKETPVIMAGFGPFGQIVARILRVKKIPFTVLEKDWQQVDFVRQFGNPVFYSDAARVEVLKAARADRAGLFIIAISDAEQSIKVAQTVRRHFPHLRVFACARTRQHAMALMDMGIAHIIRRSYFSSLELSRQVLVAMGEDEHSARHAIDTFRLQDETTLLKQQAVYRDEQQLIQSAHESARELEQLFEADASSAQRNKRA